MAFDQFAFYEVLYDIEHLLGYLKGNELAYDYLTEARNLSTGTPVEPGNIQYEVYLDWDYRFPCDRAEYRVQPYHTEFPFRVHVDGSEHDGGKAKAEAWVKQIQQGADQAWNNGPGWASGIASYAISVCEQFVRPNAVAMDQDAQDLKTNVIDHLGVALPDWAGIEQLLDKWEGDAWSAFSPFYRNTSGLLNLYANFLSYAYAGTCAATQIVDQTQTGAQKYVERLKSQVEEQLRVWVGQGSKPQSDVSLPSWIANVEAIAEDAFSLLAGVKVVDAAAGALDKGRSVSTAVTDIAVRLGATPPHAEDHFEAQTAEQMYTSLTNTLTTKYYQPYTAAMEAKFAGKPDPNRKPGDDSPFSAQHVLDLLHEQMKLYGWKPDPIGSGSFKGPDDHY